jgi:hypothetical protein
LPLEHSRHIEQKFFDCTDRLASRVFMHKSRSTTVSKASQAMISRWCLEPARAAGEKQIHESRPTPDGRRAASGKVGQSRLQF